MPLTVSMTQFKVPDGREVSVTCDVADDLAANYQQLLDEGGRLTCEVLTTGGVSIAIESESGDFDIIVCANEPNTTKTALETIIRRFDVAQFQKWEAENEL